MCKKNTKSANNAKIVWGKFTFFVPASGSWKPELFSSVAEQKNSAINNHLKETEERVNQPNLKT